MRRDVLLELGCNIVAPTAVLVLLSGEDRLGPAWSLLLALAFPVVHGISTLAVARRVSPLAILALVSVLLTGGIGLLELPVSWFAWKEAAFPLVLGVAAIASAWSPWPAIPTLLAPLLDGDKVSALLTERAEADAWDRDLRRATIKLGGVFLLSAIATFAFARWMVVSPTGTEAFTTELGRYTGLSLPVLGLPGTLLMMIVLRDLFNAMEARTGAAVEDLLRGAS